MVHVLALADLVTVCTYPTLAFLALAVVTCGILTIWPRFRNVASITRACVIVAAAVVALTVWSKMRPQSAVATPNDVASSNAAASPAGATPVAQMPSASLLAQGSPTTRPLPATVMDIEGRSFLVAELPKPATRPARAAKGSITLLGPAYTDEVNGFSVRFPAGWQIKTFANAKPWVLDAGDGRDAMISVGFASFPKDVKAEQIKPELMGQSIRSQPNTTLHETGFGAVDGRKALWAHSTGPLPMTNANPQMTRIHYLVPLQDGRALELRLAARPEKFEQLSSVMKQSAETFHLLPRAAK